MKYFPGVVGGWWVGGEIKIIDNLSPVGTETGTELGKKICMGVQALYGRVISWTNFFSSVRVLLNSSNIRPKENFSCRSFKCLALFVNAVLGQGWKKF